MTAAAWRATRRMGVYGRKTRLSWRALTSLRRRKATRILEWTIGLLQRLLRETPLILLVALALRVGTQSQRQFPAIRSHVLRGPQTLQLDHASLEFRVVLEILTVDHHR